MLMREPFLLGATWGGHTIPFYGVVPPSSQEESIELSEAAINYAMYRLINHRFENSPGGEYTLGLAHDLFVANGGDPDYTSPDYITDGGAALGNYLAQEIIEFGLQDGSNEARGMKINNTSLLILIC